MKFLKLTVLSVVLSSVAYSQKYEPGKPFFIAQFAYNKIEKATGTIGGTASLGVRFKQTFGVAVHTQLIQFSGDGNAYIPLALQLSFLPEKLKPSPYFHAALGHGFYKRVVAPNTFVAGSAFLTFGGGLFVGSKKGGGILLTASYFNAAFKYNSNLSRGTKIPNAEGVQVALGFKI